MSTPTWATPRTEQERIDDSYAFLAEVCKWAAAVVLYFIFFYGIYEHTHPLPTYLDVVIECEAGGGVAKVERGVKGDVRVVLCNRARRWDL